MTSTTTGIEALPRTFSAYRAIAGVLGSLLIAAAIAGLGRPPQRPQQQ